MNDNVDLSTLCCQNATTNYKRHQKIFAFSLLIWEFVAGCKAWKTCVQWWGWKRVLCFGILNLLTPLFLLTFVIGKVDAQPREAGLQQGFEEHQLYWTPASSQLPGLIVVHENIDLDHHSGTRCERIIFKATQLHEEQRLVVAIPPSLAFEELKSSVWVRSNCPDLRLVLRLRFPHQVDPRTGEQLTAELTGSRYTDFTRWQEIECGTNDAALNQRIKLLRAQLASQGNPVEIDTREMYVDQLALVFTVREGESVLQIDDLSFGPIVRPSELILEPQPEYVGRTRLKILDDRILKDEHPFFPVFTLYHGESLNEIRTTGVNTIWIPDYADQALLKALAEMDIGAFAQPPQLTPEEAVIQNKGLPPFPQWTEPIWAWMFGFEIPAEDVRYIESWTEHVRAADHQLRRPVLADVMGNERAFHRKVDLLGSSQFVIHTAISMPRHAQQLKHRRNLALPGKPMFTFVQTEASPPFLDVRSKEQPLPIVEPEQILHQGYAAIAAGFKGVGFWKQIPLDTNIPGLNERVHAIRLFALHCQILQPFLATGRVVDDLPVRLDIGTEQVAKGLLGPLKSRWDTPIEQINAVQNTPGSEILATVLRSDDGILILPVWYEENEQCVPGPQAARRIRMLLKGDIWQAWEVSPVSVTQSNLEVSWPAGGTEICLKEFDQHSAIIITDKPDVIQRLQRDSRLVRDESAKAMVQLASLKFERVQKTHAQLVAGNAAIPHGELLLSQAYAFLKSAKTELESNHPVEAYTAAQKSLQYLRSMQRQYWEAANEGFPSVTTSLDAGGFQTLPDHWKLLEDLGKRTRTSHNLIPTGDFESADAMLNVWSNGSTTAGKKSIHRQRDSLRNDYHLSLQIESAPGEDAAIVLASPEVFVSAGDLVVMTAQVRVVRPFNSAEDCFLMYDTLVGSQGAVRFTELKPGWQTVKIVRRINQDTGFRIRIELRGSGSVDIDDLRVHRLLP